MQTDRTALRFRIGSAIGVLGLLVWGVWWLTALRDLDLPLAGKTWLQYPVFGADFWSQPEYAARMWLAGGDPYASRGHLFHYPPIVIRAFLWVDLFSQATALRIWVLALMALLVTGAVVAHRNRARLGLSMPPLSLAIFAVLASFPVVFQLERSNFDLLTLAAILLSLPLLSKGTPGPELLGGCILAVGPWVKLYPGLMGLGLVALRRKWAVAGFVLAGVGIYLCAPGETRESFEVLGIQMARIRAMSETGPYPPWSHSLSLAWLQIGHRLAEKSGLAWAARIPESAVAGGIVLAAVFAVCLHVYRRHGTRALTYPLLLWICAVASCAPIIANDYSLAFYPLAAVGSLDTRDPWPARAGVLASLLFVQPFFLPVSSWLVLASKLLGLAGVGVSLWRRASEAGTPPAP